MDFTHRYANLNPNQRRAVDHIDGPVMVVAGPGTGKTELLSMRAAHILRQTDALPETILCLTFTESGSIAMQKRLASIIGRDAYNVSIYTFHAFGSEIMSRYRQYFYHGAEFSPADDLTRHRIVTDILHELPPSNPLKTIMNGRFTTTKGILSALSDIKRAGLSASELQDILDANQQVIDTAKPLLVAAYGSRVSKATLAALEDATQQLHHIQEPAPVAGVPRLSRVLLRSLERTCAEARAHAKTTPPLTAWKNQWLTKDARGNLVLKARQQQPRLHALVTIYQRYQAALQAAELYDFDDMIGQVIHAASTHPELAYELQETYQYIMVDEFQDTNLAQMRLLDILTSSPVHEGNPNLLVVGDDDQAIYGFQGADVGNILQFMEHYPSAELITLTDNYRSVEAILTPARQVITQGTERLEAHLPQLDKTLTAHAQPRSGSTAERVTLPTQAAERAWIAQSIAAKLAAGAPAHEIAVLGRRHADLIALLPYLAQQGIPVSYQQRDNVLEDPLVTQLVLLARVVLLLARGEHDNANALLPELLAHPAWGIAPTTLWQVSLAAYRKRQLWLEVMQTIPATKPIAEWLLGCVQASLVTPLERILDTLVGTAMPQPTTSAGATHKPHDSATAGELNDYSSPLAGYFLAASNQRYLAHIQNLNAIRAALREHQPHQSQPRLGDMLEFIDQCTASGTSITSQQQLGDEATSIRLMSAHASKGLEFDTVYLLDATNTTWGSRVRSPAPTISYPPNLRLRRSTNSAEERLRLFFVGMTRARQQLYITQAEQADSGKELAIADFLAAAPAVRGATHTTAPDIDGPAPQHTATTEWYSPLLSLPHATMQQYLAGALAQYRLSATHVNAFINVARGGPQAFLLRHLLHMPAATSPHAGYGTAIHAALQFAHDHTRAHGTPPPASAIISTFTKQLARQQLTQREQAHFRHKGVEALTAFLAHKQASFTPNQQAELSFARQQAQLGPVALTGKVDVATVDETAKTIHVIDYKTSAPLSSWRPSTDYHKIQAHTYRQQLLFYRLLASTAQHWRHYHFAGGELQFIEPTKAGDITSLELGQVSQDELDDFDALLSAIWRHIQALDFPDTSSYSPDYQGVLAFEDDLRVGRI